MRKLLLAISLLIGHSISFAQWTVFDPANYTQNIITAGQSIKNTKSLIDQYTTQLYQYQNQIQQLKNMDATVAKGMLERNAKDLINANAASIGLTGLYGSITNVQNMFSNRLATAKNMGMTWSQYTTFEQARIQRNQDGAAARAQEDIRMVERVQRDYEFAREAESKIPATAGTHESMQLMNVQMNRVITQNADLIKAMTSANNSNNNANAMADKNIKDQNDLNLRNSINTKNKARLRGELEILNQN